MDSFKNLSKENSNNHKFIKLQIAKTSIVLFELIIFAFLQYAVFNSISQVATDNNAVMSFFGIEYKIYLYSYAISTIFGCIGAYIINKLIFHTDSNSVMSTLFNIATAVLMVAFSTWFGAYIGTFLTNHHWNTVFIEMNAKIFVMAVSFLLTFAINKIVMRKSKKAKAETIAIDHSNEIKTAIAS